MPNVETLQHLGNTALYLITQLPEEERTQPFGQIGHGKRYETFQSLRGGYDRLQMSHHKKGTIFDKSDTLKGKILRNTKIGNNKETVRIVGNCRNIRTS